MEFISVFDVFKIGVGPSSSHTLGPWKAALQFMKHASEKGWLQNQSVLRVHLYGSLSLTGKGHATDLAVMMGLMGFDPETVATELIPDYIEEIKQQKSVKFNMHELVFDPEKDIVFEKEFLTFHANGLLFLIENTQGEVFSETFYSVGGGFIMWEGESAAEMAHTNTHPYPVSHSRQLIQHCQKHQLNISSVVMQNELVDRKHHEIEEGLLKIWDVMLECMYQGCHSWGYLPGSLQVKRRAAEVTDKMIGTKNYHDRHGWMEQIRQKKPGFQETIKWVGSFGIAVNEINASFGRVVTAPTNGSAGVIPAVLMYYLCFVNQQAGKDEIVRFLLTAGEIGSLFKKGSTISAAMGGCQAEIGVSSAMAAAGLTELLGGTPEQCTIAAEVAMEHHLGMTCDPIGGLVQIPCIERNSMGAIKAINASAIAMDRNPLDIKVSLDHVISTMWETAKDMNRKYKETSEGGLATAVNLIDC